MITEDTSQTVPDHAWPPDAWPPGAWISAVYDPQDRINATGGGRFGGTDPHRPVLERLGEVVAAIPDHIALDDGTTRLTYRQLWRLIGGLARAVNAATPANAESAGVTTPIAILLADDCFYAAAYFVGLATGRPVVLLDRHAPAARNVDILRDSGAETIILRAADRDDRMLPTSIVTVTLETALLEAVDADGILPGPGLPADRPVFILYTSGSTGQPKGVAVSQHGWTQLMWLRAINMGRPVGDHALRLGPMAATWGINATGGLLLGGATVHIVDLPRLGFAALLELIARRGISQIHAGPSLLKALVRMPDAAAALTGIKLIALGGDPVLRADVAEIRAALPAGCAMTNCLIATETYVAECSLTDAPPEVPGYHPHRAPSGFVGSGYELALINEAGQPCAIGEAGEICVRSRFVALGDWRDGRIDPTRFPADPTDPTRRIYRSGDIGQMAADGMLTVLGRRDRMLKINGQRIEPAEIEAAIRRQPPVLDCMVLPWQVGERPRLVAFVLPRAGATAPDFRERLAAVLRDELPSYLVPHRIEIRATFPLLPGGKIDALALLASLGEAPTTGAAASATQPTRTDDAPPSAATQALVARLWRPTLGEDATTGRNFADAGGDSLQMLQFVFRLEQALGVDLPLEAFQMDSTAAELARIADRMASGQVARVGDAPGDVPGDAPGDARGHDEPRLFLIPGIGFPDPSLAAFGARVARDMALTVLHWPDWRDLCRPGYAADNLLAELAKHVHTHAPSGPVYLAGYSIGGPVAQALARVLAEAGRTVAFLGLLDSAAILRPLAPAISTRLLHDIAKDVGLVDRARPRKHLSLAHRQSRFLARLLTTQHGLGLLRWARTRGTWNLPGAWTGLFAHRLKRDLLHRVVHRAITANAFIAKLPDVPVVLFRAGHHPPGIARDLGWSAYCPDLTIVDVAGDHVSMLTTDDGALAKAMIHALRHVRHAADADRFGSDSDARPRAAMA